MHAVRQPQVRRSTEEQADLSDNHTNRIRLISRHGSEVERKARPFPVDGTHMTKRAREGSSARRGLRDFDKGER